MIHGGRYKPFKCESKHRVAVIVPYRDRENHLKMFLDHIHPFLQRQGIEYGIFVIEMVNNKYCILFKWYYAQFIF